MTLKLKQYLPIAGFVCLLLIAAYLRLWNLEHRVLFDFDQETLAWEAKKIIINRDLTLIGMKAGPAEVFIGPGMYYVYALVYFLSQMNPLGANIFAVLMGLLTLTAIFYVAKRLFSFSEGVIAAIIYSFSFTLNIFDRLAWLLAPLVLVSLLIILFSCLYTERKEKKYLYFLTGLLGFSYHIHFTGLFFFLIVPFFFWWSKKARLNKVDLLIISLILFFWFSPLIVFDLRHNFLNLKGVLKLFSSSGAAINYGLKLKTLFRYTLENQARIFFKNLPAFSLQLSVVSLAFLALLFKRGENDKKIAKLFFLFLIVPVFVFLFYSGHVPEYYFLITFPVHILLFSRMVVYFSRVFSWFKIPLLVYLYLFVLINLSQVFLYPLFPYSLGYKKDMVEFIKAHNQGRGFELNYLTEPGVNTGFDYLFFHQLGEQAGENKDIIYTIRMPCDYKKEQIEEKVSYCAGGIGVMIEEMENK